MLPTRRAIVMLGATLAVTLLAFDASPNDTTLLVRLDAFGTTAYPTSAAALAAVAPGTDLVFAPVDRPLTVDSRAHDVAIIRAGREVVVLRANSNRQLVFDPQYRGVLETLPSVALLYRTHEQLRHAAVRDLTTLGRYMHMRVAVGVDAVLDTALVVDVLRGTLRGEARTRDEAGIGRLVQAH